MAPSVLQPPSASFISSPCLTNIGGVAGRCVEPRKLQRVVAQLDPVAHLGWPGAEGARGVGCLETYEALQVYKAYREYSPSDALAVVASLACRRGMHEKSVLTGAQPYRESALTLARIHPSTTQHWTAIEGEPGPGFISPAWPPLHERMM